eukprot:6149803-Pyramimonas_sp.AAC.1
MSTGLLRSVSHGRWLVQAAFSKVHRHAMRGFLAPAVVFRKVDFPSVQDSSVTAKPSNSPRSLQRRQVARNMFKGQSN